LIAILDSNLLSAHLHTVLRMPATGLIHMIDTMRIPDLQRIYRLYGRANVTKGLEVLMAELKKYVSTRGFAINENVTAGTSAVSADVPSASKANTTVLSSSSKLDEVTVQGAADKMKGTSSGNAPAAAPAGTAMSAAAAVNIALRWVQEVLDLKDTFDKVWKEAFEEDKAIQTALNDVSVLLLACIAWSLKDDLPLSQAFQSFINVNPKAQEYTSLFIDDNLKKGLKGVSLLQNCTRQAVRADAFPENRRRSRGCPGEDYRAIPVHHRQGYL
jgi:cullin 3